jgi:NAD(P)-dependent dehydrogenase (short-subunit alcohol dehydrogenase family)
VRGGVDLQLAGKRALVTGASSGIGAAVAKLLAAEGVVVAVHGRDVERATLVVDEIRDAGGTAVVAIGDLTDESEAAAVCAAVDAGLGHVDIVFDNAGGRAGGAASSRTRARRPRRRLRGRGQRPARRRAQPQRQLSRLN